jgi:hypothetical protein
MRSRQPVTTFALLHGTFHGAWCWDLLRPELERRGHRTVAMDLPCPDPDAGAARYAEVVAEAVEPSAEVVLVGHSLAGLVIPLLPRPGWTYDAATEEQSIHAHLTPSEPVFSNPGGPRPSPIEGRSSTSSMTALRSLRTGRRRTCARSAGRSRRMSRHSQSGRRSRAPTCSAPTTGWSIRSGLGLLSRPGWGRIRSTFRAAIHLGPPR